MLQAIPTTYAGHRFRSRLEARWALFFDFIGMRWEYEKEAFSLDVGGERVGFTPDFWLAGIRAWFEVKPAWDAMDEEALERMVGKAVGLARVSEFPVYVSTGGLRESEIMHVTPKMGDVRQVYWGRCHECLNWCLGVWDERLMRPCGHESELFGLQQVRGILTDASAYHFWDPK